MSTRTILRHSGNAACATFHEWNRFQFGFTRTERERENSQVWADRMKERLRRKTVRRSRGITGNLYRDTKLKSRPTVETEIPPCHWIFENFVTLYICLLQFYESNFCFFYFHFYYFYFNYFQWKKIFFFFILSRSVSLYFLDRGGESWIRNPLMP